MFTSSETNIRLPRAFNDSYSRFYSPFFLFTYW